MYIKSLSLLDKVEGTNKKFDLPQNSNIYFFTQRKEQKNIPCEFNKKYLLPQFTKLQESQSFVLASLKAVIVP